MSVSASTQSPSKTQASLAGHIDSNDINTAPGITLTEDQKVIIGSVLDLFKGKPSLKKLSLWDKNATFKDPITVAQGFDKYAAQWYGLKAAFSNIRQESHEVESLGPPIIIDMKSTYTMGSSTNKTIQSKVAIETRKTPEGEKITRVEDRWDGELNDNVFKNAFRHLNAVSVPLAVTVPKTDEEDAKMGNQ